MIMKLTVPVIIVVAFLLECGNSILEVVEQPPPRVNTPLGTIEGYYRTSSNGRPYEAYEGIPFAQPPIGDLRFGVPRPSSPWTGVLLAKKFAPMCIQPNLTQGNRPYNVDGSEDCLYLNIYTPIADHDQHGVDGEEDKLYPVILFIYGGAFMMGNAIKYRSEYLMNKNVTLVTLNYRLGPFGFLSTEDDIVPGNMGLKDQVIAMRWVKDNILSFGGDPSRITIFGHSAGGACVHYHYLTNLTTGLFQGGMSLSGTALNPWALSRNSLEQTKKLATIVECPTDNVQFMVDCLKARPAHQIIETVGEFMLFDTSVPFRPVAEKKGGEFTFIDRPPIEIITSGEVQDVPWITSVVSEESFFLLTKLLTSDRRLQELNNNWETIAPDFLDFYNTCPKIDHPRAAMLIRQHYFGTSPIGKSTANQIVKMASDRLFRYSAEDAARLQAKANRSPVRFFYFPYRGAHSFSETLTGSSENFGVIHADDVSYIFGTFLDPTTTPEDRKMQEAMINIWVSFASEGEPDVGVEWPVVGRSIGELDYLHIERPGEISVKTSLDFGETDFWHSIGFHENNINYPIKRDSSITSADLEGEKSI